MNIAKSKQHSNKLFLKALTGINLLLVTAGASATVAVTGGSFNINFDTSAAPYYAGYVSPTENGNSVVHDGSQYGGTYPGGPNPGGVGLTTPVTVSNGQAYGSVTTGLQLLYAINNNNPTYTGFDINPSTTAVIPINNNVDNITNPSGAGGGRARNKTTLTFNENATDLASLAASMTGVIGTSGLVYQAIPGTKFGSVDGDWTFDSAANPLNAAAGTWNGLLGIDFLGVPVMNLTDIALTHIGVDGFTLTGNASSAFGAFYGSSGPLGTFTLNVTTSAVPVPAAVWLFGSALLGLTGLNRRKSGKAA